MSRVNFVLKETGKRSGTHSVSGEGEHVLPAGVEGDVSCHRVALRRPLRQVDGRVRRRVVPVNEHLETEVGRFSIVRRVAEGLFQARLSTII